MLKQLYYKDILKFYHFSISQIKTLLIILQKLFLTIYSIKTKKITIKIQINLNGLANGVFWKNSPQQSVFCIQTQYKRLHQTGNSKPKTENSQNRYEKNAKSDPPKTKQASSSSLT